MRFGNQFILWPLAIAVAVAGCGGDNGTGNRPKPSPASGTVLLNGNPVVGATVVFQPEGHTQAANGLTDDSGKFELQTYDPRDGAVPGTFKVTITKILVEAPAASDETQEETDVNDTSVPESTWEIPRKYGNSATSGLTAEVRTGGENNFTFELKK